MAAGARSRRSRRRVPLFLGLPVLALAVGVAWAQPLSGPVAPYTADLAVVAPAAAFAAVAVPVPAGVDIAAPCDATADADVTAPQGRLTGTEQSVRQPRPVAAGASPAFLVAAGCQLTSGVRAPPRRAA
jgi:hypothetical protein